MTWVQTPADDDPHSLAEFIEAELMLSGDEYLSIAELRDNWLSGSTPTEEVLEFGLAEIERRAEICGALYPFNRLHDGVALTSDPRRNLYFFLLLLALKETPLRLDKDYPRSDPIFDAVVRAAAISELGVGAKALVFGWPPRDGRPKDFPAAVEWLAGQIGVELRSREARQEARDAGVDVVLWRPFPDAGQAFPLYLIQNTIQRAFVKKPRDVIPGEWREWLRIKADPQVGFAVPFAMPKDDPWWDTAARDVAIVWDRHRLMHDLRHSDPQSWVEWSALQEFVNGELSGMRSRASGMGPLDSVERPRKPRQPVTPI